jgi:transcriptional regulator GlxA family with amidase domain
VAAARPRQIVIVTYDNGQLLDVAGPLQAFATTNQLLGGAAAPYRLDVVSTPGGPVTMSSGLPIVTRQLADFRRQKIDTLIVAGGPGVHAAVKERALVDWVKRQGGAARRTCSVCTGAFLLAATGLLAGRRATTHWRSCSLLQEQHPEIRVEDDPIFVREGRLWTSAGVTAGIDLALALIQEDLGRDVAMQAARQLVVFLKRPGGQSQFSAPLAAQTADDGTFSALRNWMAGNLDRDLRVERLAERAGMSPRHFARLFTGKLGATPAKLVEGLRLEAARRALEDGVAPIKTVARRCGFGDEERLRRAFVRRLGISPLQYRSRFAA